jgi:protein-S-isoprenylcysteine O-methyltransferase Ste14
MRKAPIMVLMAIAFIFGILLWSASELFVLLFKTDFTKGTPRTDPTTPLFLSLLYLAILSPVSMFIFRTSDPWAELVRFSPPKIVAVVLLFSGIGFRWLAIGTLKTSFSSQLMTKADQTLIVVGIFKYVRHPSYLGSMVTFWGFTLFFENLTAFCISAVLVFTAYDYRIGYEEGMLTRRFGLEYEDYSKRTRKLFPFIY